MIDALVAYYSEDNANVHRGVHLLSERATDAYEARARHGAALPQRRRPRARSSSRAAPPKAINLVAQTFGAATLGAGDEVLISAMEHHSNIVPWQMLCEEKGASLRVDSDHRRRRAAARRVRAAARAAHTKLVAIVTSVERARARSIPCSR